MLNPIPTLRLVSQCKVCQIAKKLHDETLFKQIHELRFLKNYTLEELVTYIVPKMVQYPEKSVPNIMNLSKHFNKHCSTDLIATYKVQNRRRTTTLARADRTLSTDIKDTVSKIENVMDEKRVEIYAGLETLYQTLQNRFNDYDTKNNGVMDNANAYIYAGVVKELRGCLKELNQIKQSEQVLRLVINTAFSNYTLETLQGVLAELQQMKQVLKFYIKDITVLDNLIGGAEANIGNRFTETSKSVLTTIKEQFRIN